MTFITKSSPSTDKLNTLIAELRSKYAEEHARLIKYHRYISWIASLDNPDSVEISTVTLTSIIDRAKEAMR